MSLTNDEKAQYVAAIAAVWPVDMPNNNVNNISDEVAGIMDQVLQAIKECSQAFAGVNIVFAVFYGVFPPSSWASVLVNALQSGTSVTAWIEALRGNAAYNACVVTAAANWRSAIELALIGLRKQSPETP
ncbi:MAG: hypothetical protein LBO79_00135 [Zoogloeaceae bacterium]|jgi:hypothetical protein|nr:hypothetical protein [Zoogloeaceae bacterium]